MENISAFALAKKIKSGEVKSLDIVSEFIERIQKVNPKLNAIVETRFEEARDEARAADFKVQKGEQDLGPLHGVPYTLKEMIAFEGMRSTMGSVHRRTYLPKEDATVVKRLKAAGAILLGTSNVPEVGFWFECDNPIYGCTKNPYDQSRTSGGSSGGEGAIIGAGASLFGIGSDIGGSIRMPAFFCGIFGHKPSDKIIPMTGHPPVYRETIAEVSGPKYPFTVMGPMSRKASDLYDLMSLLIGPDDVDPETVKDFELKPRVKDWSKIKVYTLPAPIIHGTTETEEDISQAVRDAGKYFEQLGCKVEELPARTLLRGFDVWTGRTWAMERNFEAYVSAGNSVHLGKEFLRLATGRRNYTLPSLLTVFVDKYLTDKESLKAEYAEELRKLRSQMTDLLGENAILLMPPHPRKAPRLHSTYTRPFDFSYTGVINALGFPGTSAPTGISEDGLPLGVQVVASYGQDHLTLSAAEVIESAFGGWQAPQL